MSQGIRINWSAARRIAVPLCLFFVGCWHKLHVDTSPITTLIGLRIFKCSSIGKKCSTLQQQQRAGQRQIQSTCLPLIGGYGFQRALPSPNLQPIFLTQQMEQRATR